MNKFISQCVYYHSVRKKSQVGKNQYAKMAAKTRCVFQKNLRNQPLAQNFYAQGTLFGSKNKTTGNSDYSGVDFRKWYYLEVVLIEVRMSYVCFH